MSDSVRPHRQQPTRLHCPWDSPGKNPGVGCHFLLQYMKVKSESEVAQSCPTFCNPMGCSMPGFPVLHYLQNLLKLMPIELVAAAKSLQLCPILCHPIDASPPGSPVPGILQARTVEWVAISFSRGSSQPRRLNLGLQHGRHMLYHLSQQRSPLSHVLS